MKLEWLLVPPWAKLSCTNIIVIVKMYWLEWCCPIDYWGSLQSHCPVYILCVHAFHWSRFSFICSVANVTIGDFVPLIRFVLVVRIWCWGFYRGLQITFNKSSRSLYHQYVFLLTVGGQYWQRSWGILSTSTMPYVPLPAVLWSTVEVKKCSHLVPHGPIRWF